MWEWPLGRRVVVSSPAPGEDVDGGKGDGMFYDGCIILLMWI